MQSLRRGSIFFAYLNPVMGSEQGGLRPVVIIQNDIGNYYSDTTVVAIVTKASHRKPDLPTHVFIKSRAGLKFDSVIMTEQIRTIDNIRLKSYVGNLDERELFLLDKAIKISLQIV